MSLMVQAGGLSPFEVDDAGVCERAVLRECAERSSNWDISWQERATVLLRTILRRRVEWDQVGVLLQGASIAMLQAAVGPVCGIEGQRGEVVFPELRWCEFPRMVCYRAGATAPLYTKQFEACREYLEQLWRGPVVIEPGPIPGSIVVRAAPRVVAQIARVPAPPREPLILPEKIPLEIPPREGGRE